MKTKFLSIGAAFMVMAVLFLACGGGPTPVSAPAVLSDELDVAIRETSDYLNGQLPRGNKLVILNIQSDYPALSEYVIDELIANIVNDKVFSVVDRQQLDTIRAELDFQMSDEVDDNTAQTLGRMAGAQIIVSGAVSRVGDLYRLRIRALSVESARIEGQFNRNIPEGPTVAALVKSRATGYGGESGYGGTTPAITAAPAAPAAAAPVTTPAAPVAAAVAPASVPAAAPAAPPSAPSTYKSGDRGPAGGFIFYSNEVAQEDAPLPPLTRDYGIGEAGPGGGAVFYPVAQVVTPLPPLTRDYGIGDTGPASGVVFYPAALVTAAPVPATQEYEIGDTGPAGGVIFFINPQAGEWTYLEAAPASTETQIRWGANGVDAGGKGASIGEGKTNTQTILRAMNEVGVSVPAVQYCVNLNQGGFQDWFLPSKAELNLMYSNLKMKGLGGFKNETYWSSTESGSDTAWYQNFSDGSQIGYHGKDYPRYVRAVRAF
ncbi:MAG: DUF1566 domain-containing protein [Treponema sp.]|jgi:hypothetical protein|nr:DUF1566 domain-containing protein [Treponema sp.]